MQRINGVSFNFTDCDKTCTVGMLNEACDTCICESPTIKGRVLSTAGNPVSYAALAAETTPLRIIAQSNSTGFFILGDTCINSTVIVTREGFQDTVVAITSAYQTIYVDFEGNLLSFYRLQYLKRFTEMVSPTGLNLLVYDSVARARTCSLRPPNASESQLVKLKGILSFQNL